MLAGLRRRPGRRGHAAPHGRQRSSGLRLAPREGLARTGVRGRPLRPTGARGATGEGGHEHRGHDARPPMPQRPRLGPTRRAKLDPRRRTAEHARRVPRRYEQGARVSTARRARADLVQGLGPARPRRRGLPHRPEVGLPAQAGRRPALPGGQRRRVRAGHLQGHPADAGDPALPDRGRDHHPLRDRLPSRRSSTCAARSCTSTGGCSGRGRRLRRRLPRREHPRLAASTSRSSCTPARAPTSAARRPRCSTRSRAGAASRG